MTRTSTFSTPARVSKAAHPRWRGSDAESVSELNDEPSMPSLIVVGWGKSERKVEVHKLESITKVAMELVNKTSDDCHEIPFIR